jgi:hypothetical protein
MVMLLAKAASFLQKAIAVVFLSPYSANACLRKAYRLNIKEWNMLYTIPRKRIQALSLALILTMLVISVTAFAATELISAKKGGKIEVAQGVLAVIKPHALEEDTIISANMEVTRDRISFVFGPSGTQFKKPMELYISWSVIDDVEDLAIYGEDNEEIEPVKINGRGLKYHINHFSIYYFRRR